MASQCIEECDPETRQSVSLERDGYCSFWLERTDGGKVWVWSSRKTARELLYEETWGKRLCEGATVNTEGLVANMATVVNSCEDRAEIAMDFLLRTFVDIRLLHGDDQIRE